MNKETCNAYLNEWITAYNGCNDLWLTHQHDQEYCSYLTAQGNRILHYIIQDFYPMSLI